MELIQISTVRSRSFLRFCLYSSIHKRLSYPPSGEQEMRREAWGDQTDYIETEFQRKEKVKSNLLIIRQRKTCAVVRINENTSGDMILF